jgi:hypothetical protein
MQLRQELRLLVSKIFSDDLRAKFAAAGKLPPRSGQEVVNAIRQGDELISVTISEQWSWGISDIEGKATMGSSAWAGKWTSFNRAGRRQSS